MRKEVVIDRNNACGEELIVLQSALYPLRRTLILEVVSGDVEERFWSLDKPRALRLMRVLRRWLVTGSITKEEKCKAKSSNS